MKHLSFFDEFISETNKNININTLVVDANNKPLIMYHGGASFANDTYNGITWFTSSKADAKDYAKKNYGVLSKAYLVIVNPLYTGDIKHLNLKPTKEFLKHIKKRNLSSSVIVENNIISFIEANSGVILARDMGNDGIIDISEGSIVDVVVFKKEQIIEL